jgi:hypothetical protein
MSDEVGVDVERIGQLASALENLRDVLTANVPTIVNTMNSYGAPINLQPLQQAQHRSVGDATDIRDRATMAVAYQNRPNPTLSGGMLEIPWDSSQQQLDADSSKAAAQNLAAAEAEAKSNPKLAKAQIAAAEADMQDNLDSKDTGWIQDFYNNGGAAAAANLAQTLHNLETPNEKADYADRFQVLNSADQKTVATFANGLAIADKAGLSTQAVQSLVNSPNMWSTAMLVQYGPPGSSWATNEAGKQPSLLAQLTLATYQDMQNGKITIPVGFGTTGSHGPTTRYDAQDMNRLDSLLQSNDPLQILMQADAQNKNAAWQVLGNKTYGGAIANMLLNSQKGDLPEIDGRYAQQFGSDGQYTGTFALIPPGKSVPQQDDFGAISINTPDQNVVGAFLNAATSAPRGTDINAEEAAQAAMNIIDSTPPGTAGQLAAPVQAALLATAQRYMLDLATSTGNTNSSQSMVQYMLGNSSLPWTIDIAHDSAVSNGDPLANFLQQITANPTDDGILMASAKTMFGQYYGLTATDKLPAAQKDGDPSYFLAKLMGQIQTQSNTVGISNAEAVDAQHAEYNALLSFAESEVTKVPVVGAPLGDAQTAAGALGISLPTFSTDNATNSYNTDLQDFAKAQMQLNVPMVQALLSAHVISPPITSGGENSWYKNGTINLASSAEMDQFNNWYSQVVKTPTHNSTLEGDLTTYQNAMGLEQSSTLTPPPGS